MVMLQTTNNIFNASLYKQVVPQSLMAWQRVRIANMMAHGGQQWSQILDKYNSGEVGIVVINYFPALRSVD